MVPTVCCFTEFTLLLDTVIDVPVAQVVQFVNFPVVAQRRLPKVFQTMESPQFSLAK